MDENILGSGRNTRCVGKENFSGPMGECSKGNFQRTKKRAWGPCSTKTAEKRLGFGKTTNPMGRPTSNTRMVDEKKSNTIKVRGYHKIKLNKFGTENSCY